MSKYTTEVRYICETFSGLDESKGCFNINEIIEARSKQIDKLTEIEGLGKKISQGIQEELNLDQQIKQETEEIKEGKEDLEQKINLGEEQ